MSFKTTLLLAIALVVMGGLYLVTVEDKSAQSSTADDPAPIPGTSKISQPVFEGELGDIVKVVCKADGKEEWVFEKIETDESGDQNNWRITSPIDAKAIPWEVQRFGTQLKNLKYEISHEPGGTVTGTKAGLDPPQAVVTITDTDGESATFEIGLEASPTETYVSLVDDDTIYVGQGVVGTLVKSNVLDYRDQQLWNFSNDDATRISITDHHADPPITYELEKQNDNWVFTSPVSARATGKVTEMLRTLGVLRVQKWVDSREDRLTLYGLNPPHFTVTVTTESMPEGASTEEADDASDDTDDQPEPQAPVVNTYTLMVSDQSPIGEDTKVYVSPGGEAATGVIMKTLADRLAPDLSAWRDMDLSPVNLTRASRVELNTANGNATLVRLGQDWKYESDSELAEATAIRSLLLALNDLKAVSYVEAPEADDAVFGLDKPQATVSLTVPGEEEPERITIGGFTDPNSRRLVYVRRNAMSAVAKARLADVQLLLRDPRSYRNLTILDAKRDAIEQIVLETPAACIEGRQAVTFANEGGSWRITDPVAAPVNDTEFNALLDLIAGMKANAVVGDAEALSAFGLHNPNARVTVRYQPAAEIRLMPDPDDPEKLKQVESQPATASVTVSFASHEGMVYAVREDRNLVYTAPRELLNRILTEQRQSQLFSFDAAAVRSFAVTEDGITHEFERDGDQWTYATEPDLPLDAAKVDNLLIQFGDLVTPRFVKHGEFDKASFGLKTPNAQVAIDTGETVYRLTVFPETCGPDGANGRFAMANTVPGLFLLMDDSLARIDVNLGNLEPGE